MNILPFKIFLHEKISKTKLDYHSELNLKLWNDNNLLPKVSDKLNEISNTFIDFLDIDKNLIHDVVFTGSNTNYNYTDLSDIDIHISIDFKKFKGRIKPEDYFDAMKTNWNLSHDIKIYGHDVEIYVNDKNENLVGDSSAYSIKNKKWIKEPKQKVVEYPEKLIKQRANYFAKEIDKHIKLHHNDKSDLEELNDKIGKMRRSGLTKQGEFSLENLVFKVLRNNGYVDKLRKQIKKAEDSKLNLESMLEESFGTTIFNDFKHKFSNFNPTFKHDGKTISFDVNELDKDGLLVHLNTFLGKIGNRIKKDLGDIGAYKLTDDNIVVLKQPEKNGKRYTVNLKFSY